MTRHDAPAESNASLFERIVAAADPTRVAVASPEGALSYAQLLARAERLAARLANRRSPVLVYGHKQPAMVVAFLAALCRGRAYVPVDVSCPPARLARMLEAAAPEDAILAGPAPDEIVAELRAHPIEVQTVDALATDLAPDGESTVPTPESSVVDPENPAYIMFTSGTTGAPKGVPVPYRALAHFTGWLLAAHNFARAAETFLNQAPFSFDLSVMDLYGALLTGGTLFCVSRDEIANPRALFHRLDHAPITTWVSTPSFARLCLVEPRFGEATLPWLRRFLFCGETLAPSLARELIARFPRAEVWNTYGPTETTVCVTAVRITAERAASDEPLPVGWPAPGVAVWVAEPGDPTRPLPRGERGEIVIAGPQVALGYLQGTAESGRSSSATAFLTLADGRPAYRTGDLGRLDPAEGLLYWDGRLDRQVKLHGHRLELEEVEACLRRIPGVADAIVAVVDRLGVPDHLVAELIADEASGVSLPTDSFDLTQLARSALAEHLPAYALPRRVSLRSSLSLTINGKLDRRGPERVPS